MFWLLTKKLFRKESKKISQSFLTQKELIDKATNSITELTSQSLNNRIKIENQGEKIARLEGVLSVIMQGNIPKSQSHSQAVPINLNKTQGNFETKLMNRVRRSKKSLIMAEISKLTASNSTIEMYEIIVLEKGLCSKASFYRYVASLKSQIPMETKTELRN